MNRLSASEVEERTAFRRRKLIEYLYRHGPQTPQDLYQRFGQTWSAVALNKLLRDLVAAEIVYRDVAGKWAYNATPPLPPKWAPSPAERERRERARQPIDSRVRRLAGLPDKAPRGRVRDV